MGGSERACLVRGERALYWLCLWVWIIVRSAVGLEKVGSLLGAVHDGISTWAQWRGSESFWECHWRGATVLRRESYRRCLNCGDAILVGYGGCGWIIHPSMVIFRLCLAW